MTNPTTSRSKRLCRKIASQIQAPELPSLQIDVTIEDLMADLDPGWLEWRASGASAVPGHPSRNAA